MTSAPNSNMPDTDSRRRSADYRPSEKVCRILWLIAGPLFHWSPRLFYGWRNTLLRGFGANVGQRVQIYPSVKIFAPWQLKIGDGTTIGDQARIYNVGSISIGSHVTISQHAHLCAGSHDYRRPDMKLLRMPICIQNNVWICADAFIGPGVSIGENTIVGARSAVFGDLESDVVVGGNPARLLKHRHDGGDCSSRNAA